MDPFVGEIRIFGGSFAPQGWAFCDGSLLPIASYTALFSLLGTTYGGDGVSNFALPDLRGRVPVHMGSGPGLSNYTIGQRGGAETVSLTASQLPSHTHAANCANNTNVGNQASPSGNYWSTDPGGNTGAYNNAANSGQLSANAIEPAGGGQPHGNLQPFMAINYIIAWTGIYPSRS